MSFFMIIIYYLFIVDVSCQYHNRTEAPALAQVEVCRMKHQSIGKLPTLEGLVGIGWDNLRNIPMAMVLSSKFDECRTTVDGNYLVPDHMEVLPIKKLNVDKTAEYYETFADYFRTQTDTINFEEGGTFKHFSISGSFDAKFQESKERFITGKSIMLHSMLKYHAYTLIVQAQKELSKDFVSRLNEIYDALKHGLKRKAKYLAELIIYDFGTHVITKADVGATLEQEDYIDAKATQDQEIRLEDMKFAASTNFFQSINFKLSSEKNVSSRIQEKFSSSLRHTKLYTNGGLSIYGLLTEQPKEDKKQVWFNVVVIDRDGSPIYTLITQDALPNMRISFVDQIALLIKNSTEEFYNRNKIDGCTDPSAPNFYPDANVNDDTCHKHYYNETFGGAFQKCQILTTKDSSDVQYRCDQYRQVNGDTGDYTCGSDFQAEMLMKVEIYLPDRHEKRSHKDCKDHVFWETCTTYHYDITFKDVAVIKTYVCKVTALSIAHKDKGFLFGGLFSRKHLNPFTGAMTCPGRYLQYNIFDMIVCLSKDYQLDGPFSLSFGGFFSCQTPKKRAKCDSGYSQHLATVVDGCDVYYCVRPDEFKRVKMSLIKRPPFMDPFALSNETESMIYGYVNDTFWMKKSVSSVLQEMANRIKNSENGSNSFNMTTMDTIDQWLKTIEIPLELKKKNLVDNSSPWIFIQKTKNERREDFLPLKITILAIIGLGILFSGIGLGIISYAIYQKHKNQNDQNNLLSQFQQPIMEQSRPSMPSNEYNKI